MKCEHGKDIRVSIELKCQYWDDGIVYYDQDGRYINIYNAPEDTPKHVRIIGCDHCRTIEIVE